MVTAGDGSILIVGAGIGGLSVALRLADQGRAVTVIAKGPLDQSASFNAQGGIAAVMNPGDSLGEHESDTVVAGAGLCHADTVARVVEQGPECIRWLESKGVHFTRTSPGGELHLTREGGHSQRRIVHADDATGAAVMTALTEQVRAHPLITLRDGTFVSQLVTSAGLGMAGPNRCVGLRAVNPVSGALETLWADAVVLATGGASGLYEHATNTASGDGIAMAWRAGCRVANLEFIQFHPTCLYSSERVSILITEAVRGEGGILRLPDGTPFMHRYDERGDLAPRDIVSRAIVSELRRLGIEHVLLDISHQPAEVIRERFPNVLKACAAHGYDMTREPIPVVPAAHYTCGGIVVDAHGRTDIGQLYALGECSFTGLHGANRLASNSLLEALAFADTISVDIRHAIGSALGAANQASLESTSALPGDTAAVIDPSWVARLRRTMSEYVGIVRTRAGLDEAADALDALEAEFEANAGPGIHSGAGLELRNMLTVAKLITRSARERHESRGLHFNADFPGPLPEPRDTALCPVT
jgi:L-aspartate oxidase